MDSNSSRDLAKKKRKGTQADRKKPEEEADHGFVTVGENTEQKCTEEDDSEHQLQEKAALQERAALSAEMEASIQEIRQKVDQFTQQVSGLLEAVKAFFVETSNTFEERLVLLHQAQIDKWEEEIKLLSMIDSENEEMNFRLSNAQELLNSM